jgi:branched-chain amino acid transport system permease protein
MTFGISAAYAGVGGALGGLVVQLVAPDSFTIFLSMSFIIGITVGGIGSITGPFVGALFIQFVPNVADEIGKAAPWAVYGLVLIVVLYLAPDGVAGTANQLLRRLAAWLPRRRG